MNTPKRPGAGGDSPDPLSELDPGQNQNQAAHAAYLTSSAVGRVTRSQRSQSMYSLDQRSHVHASRFSSSPRKQTFHLDVGDEQSPQKIRVTVETADEGGYSNPGGDGGGEVGNATLPQMAEERVKRRLFRAPSQTTQTPDPSLLVPSLPPPPPTLAATPTAASSRPRRSVSPRKSLAATAAAKRSRASLAAAAKTTTVPLRGLSDDEEDELDTTNHTVTSIVPLADSTPAGMTPKRKRGRPRRSGTPMPDKTMLNTLVSSPPPSSPTRPASRVAASTPAKRGRKPRAVTPKDEDENDAAADELASTTATPMMQSPPDKRTARAGRTPAASAGRTPRTTRSTRASASPSHTAPTDYSSGTEMSSSFRVSKRGRGRPRRQAMAPDEMAAIAEERDDQVVAAAEPEQTEPEQPAAETQPEQPEQVQLEIPEADMEAEDDGGYDAPSPDPFLDMFDDAPVARPANGPETRVAASPALTSLSSVDLINVQTPAADRTITQDFDYQNATSPLDLLRSPADYSSPLRQGVPPAMEPDLMHFSGGPSPFVQQASAPVTRDMQPAAKSPAFQASPAVERASALQARNVQNAAKPAAFSSPRPRPHPVQAKPATENMPQSERDGDADPAHFSDSGPGSDAPSGFYHGFDDGRSYIAESELGVGSSTYAASERARSRTPGSQNTISKGEDFSMIGLESLQSSFQQSHGPLPEMGDVTSRIVNRSLEVIRHDQGASHGDDSHHDGMSYLDFLTGASSPSSVPSVVSAHQSPLPVTRTPPRRTSPLKKAMPLAKILGRKSLAPVRQAVEEMRDGADRDEANDTANTVHEQEHPTANDTVDDEEPSRQYDDSFSEIPDAVLDAAANDNDNDTLYFSKQQAELTGRVDVSVADLANVPAAESPIPPLPPSSPFPLSPAAPRPESTPSRLQTTAPGRPILAPGPAAVEYAPSPLRQAVTPGHSDASSAAATPASAAAHNDAVHEPEEQESSPSRQMVTSGAAPVEHTTEPASSPRQMNTSRAAPVDYTTEPASSPRQMNTSRAAPVDHTTEPVSSPRQMVISGTTPVIHTTEPASSPPSRRQKITPAQAASGDVFSSADQINGRLGVPSDGFRPSLSPIVRAGRVLQSVTSSPPTPKEDRLLRSPFRGVATSSPAPPAGQSGAVPAHADEDESESESDSEHEHEPANYELVTAQLQREVSASVAASEANYGESESEGEDERQDEGEDQYDDERVDEGEPEYEEDEMEYEDEQEHEEEQEQEEEEEFEEEPEQAQEPVQAPQPKLRRAPESSPPPASSLRAWAMAKNGRTRSPRLRRGGSSSPPGRMVADADAESPVSSPAQIITPTPLVRPASKKPSLKRSFDRSGLEDAGASLSQQKRTRPSGSPPRANSSRSSNSSRLSGKSQSQSQSKSKTPSQPIIRGVQQTPAHGVFAQTPANEASTGRTWRSLVFRENGIVGSISNLASKLISHIPATGRAAPEDPQPTEPEMEETTMLAWEQEQREDEQREKQRELEREKQREKQRQEQLKEQREQQREQEQLEKQQREQEKRAQEKREEQQRRHEKREQQRELKQQREQERREQELELQRERDQQRAQAKLQKQRELEQQKKQQEQQEREQQEREEEELEKQRELERQRVVKQHREKKRQEEQRKLEQQREQAQREQAQREQEQREQAQRKQEQRRVEREREAERNARKAETSFARSARSQGRPAPPHSDTSSTHYGSDAIQSMINDISLEGQEVTVDASRDHGSIFYPRLPERHDVTGLTEQTFVQHDDDDDYEPEPMDINSIHEPLPEPEPMDINSTHEPGPQDAPAPSQGAWDDDDVDIWAVEAERTTRVSTMPTAPVLTAPVLPAPSLPAPSLPAPPAAVPAVSPGLSFHSTPLSPVQEVLSSSVVKPTSVLRSTPPTRPKRPSAASNVPTELLDPRLLEASAPAPVQAPATAAGQRRFLDEFFSSPAVLPQELAPTNEADVRFNEQARQRAIIEREQRRQGSGSAVSSFDQTLVSPDPSRHSFVAESSSPAGLVSSPSRAGPAPKESVGYYSQQMEAIANSTHDTDPLANFFEHTYAEPDNGLQVQAPQYDSASWQVAAPSGGDVTPTRAVVHDDADSSFLTPDLRPLPPRSASPTKSCMRPKTKPKVSGRVVVIREDGDPQNGVPMQLTDGGEVLEERASRGSDEQRFASHFGLGEDDGAGTGTGPALVSSPSISEASWTLQQVQTEPGYAAFYEAEPVVRGPFSQPASITTMPKRDWDMTDWIELNEVVHAIRMPLSPQTSGPVTRYFNGRPSTTQPWTAQLDHLRRQDEEARHGRRSHVLQGKVVHTDTTAMLVKAWHLDIVDAFVFRSGRVFNEHFVLRRLFSLLLSEMQRGVFAPKGWVLVE